MTAPTATRSARNRACVRADDGHCSTHGGAFPDMAKVCWGRPAVATLPAVVEAVVTAKAIAADVAEILGCNGSNHVPNCSHIYGRIDDWAAGVTLTQPRLTHGRHCPCGACRREDWTNPGLASCGMHGPSCPPVYAPLTQPQPDSVHAFLVSPDHILDGLTCWCRPYRDATDPEVIIHHSADDLDSGWEWYASSNEMADRIAREYLALTHPTPAESSASAARSLGKAPCRSCGHIEDAHPYCCTGGGGHLFRDARSGLTLTQPQPDTGLDEALDESARELHRWHTKHRLDRITFEDCASPYCFDARAALRSTPRAALRSTPAAPKPDTALTAVRAIGTCQDCNRSLRRDEPVVWLSSGGHRCFACWTVTGLPGSAEAPR